jgi:hypothetical protein
MAWRGSREHRQPDRGPWAMFHWEDDLMRISSISLTEKGKEACGGMGIAVCLYMYM